MTRKNILLLVLGSIVLEIIGLLLFAPAAARATSHCTQEQINAGICAAGPFGARGIIGVILLVGGGILQLIAWILALVRSAKMGSWVWFVVVLLISQLGTLLYALFGPADRPRLPAYPGYPPTGYPPPGYPPPGYSPPAGYPPPGSPTATG
jgi:hypothetical protein